MSILVSVSASITPNATAVFRLSPTPPQDFAIGGVWTIPSSSGNWLLLSVDFAGFGLPPDDSNSTLYLVTFAGSAFAAVDRLVLPRNGPTSFVSLTCSSSSTSVCTGVVLSQSADKENNRPVALSLVISTDGRGSLTVKRTALWPAGAARAHVALSHLIDDNTVVFVERAIWRLDVASFTLKQGADVDLFANTQIIGGFVDVASKSAVLSAYTMCRGAACTAEAVVAPRVEYDEYALSLTSGKKIRTTPLTGPTIPYEFASSSGLRLSSVRSQPASLMWTPVDFASLTTGNATMDATARFMAGNRLPFVLPSGSDSVPPVATAMCAYSAAADVGDDSDRARLTQFVISGVTAAGGVPQVTRVDAVTTPYVESFSDNYSAWLAASPTSLFLGFNDALYRFGVTCPV